MKNIFSGVQPSGEITLGNYIGAIRNFVNLQNEYQCYFCVVDLHAITVPQDSLELNKRIKDVAALYIACGIDPEKAVIFIQSEVSAHAELSWILECHTYIGELSRMTQFKEKTKNANQDGISSGLFTYPVLMAADILLYDSHLVPVGDDQKQHIEITRDIATRFNNRYGETFVIPEIYTSKVGARIMDLQNPEMKMSKSESGKGCIFLLEDLKSIYKKIMSAVTDSEMKIKYDKEKKPGISNLLTIYSAITNQSIESIEKQFVNSNYGDFKKALANVLVSFIEPIQDRFHEIRNSSILDEILDRGREIAEKVSYQKLLEVKKKIGLLRQRTISLSQTQY